MSRRKMLMSVMLMGVVSMFTTSCVQGDLYDDFFDGDFLPRCKKSKDIDLTIIKNSIAYDAAVIEAKRWVQQAGFSSSCNECFALALYNCCQAKNRNKTAYECRRKVGTTFYSQFDSWEYQYKRVVENGSVRTGSFENEASVIYDMTGLKSKTNWESWLKSREGWNLNGKVIVGVNLNHFGVVMTVERVCGGYYVVLKDQSGSRNAYSLSYVDSAYY